MRSAKREVVRQALEALAEEMGEVLARSAFSPNIKERRDHSCAVFTSGGDAVAQAEHIPVHLGAMPLAVDAVLEHLGQLEPGDVAVVNDPAAGGTHLPDLTLVRPAYHEGTLVGYVAARAHHADVGGQTPGSMPAGATRLEDEGLVLAPTLLLEGDAWCQEVRETILSATRDPQERAGDLEAQHGALVTGQRRLVDLTQRYGCQALAEGMEAILDHTQALARTRLEGHPPGPYEATALLEDDGTGQGPHRICAEAHLEAGRLHLDYTGTDPQVPGNLNAPLPVTLAGAGDVLRVLLGRQIPANEGLARVIELEVPEGTLLNPEPGAAVAGGNVETSQRNVDLLFRCLAPAFPDRTPAASQGTMNNLTLGGHRSHGRSFTYYETLGGGEGGTPHRPGASGIHTHMTNTRNTPIETLEHAYPLRVVAQTLRRGSGGQGRHHGGDGIRRAIQVLVDGVEVNLITTRRQHGPEGLAGGQDGAPGDNRLTRADGSTEALPGIARVVLDEGDVLIVETPGGGGWGDKEVS